MWHKKLSKMHIGGVSEIEEREREWETRNI